MFKKELSTDPYLDRLADSNPNLYNELLLEFLKHPQTKEAIVRHESTPMEVLRLISREKLSQDLDFMLQHPNCPPELIEQKIKEGNESDLLEIAKNCSINVEQINELAKNPSSSVLFWICRRPDCPPDVLESTFLVCEKKYEEAVDISEDGAYELSSDPIIDISDNLDLFEIGDFILAIAANPNTPQQIFKKMLKMNLNLEDTNGDVLGSVLLQNFSVSDEDKVFLSLSGFVKTIKDSSQDYSMINYYGLPTAIAFTLPNFPQRFRQALANVGQPLALLDPDIEILNQKYKFNEIIGQWIKHETIYRTLWPELGERNDISFFYQRSSYDGDNFYFDCRGVEFEHNFLRGAYTYNSMSYPFIERPWVETVETMDIEMSHENFSRHEIEEMFDYASGEDDYEVILASIISKNFWAQEVPIPQYSLTRKGNEFVCEWAESFFADDRDLRVIVYPLKALPYSWKALSSERKDKITEVIIEGFKAKVDTKYQYAEHFLACIALNPYTPNSIKSLLKEVDSKVVSQALEAS